MSGSQLFKNAYPPTIPGSLNAKTMYTEVLEALSVPVQVNATAVAPAGSVTVNGRVVQITTTALTTATALADQFTLVNSSLVVGSKVHAEVVSYSGTLAVPVVVVHTVTAGTCSFAIASVGGAVLNGAVTVQFTIL